MREIVHKMDEFDRKILDALQRDGALGRAELAKKAGLSESQAARRRQALEERGMIRRYRAELDPRALGFTVTAFIHVKLKGHSDGHARRFRDLVRLTPGVFQVENRLQLRAGAELPLP